VSEITHTTAAEEERRKTRRFKWVIGTPYFVQGSSELISTPALFFIKYALAMGDAGGQLFQSLMSFGWYVKPIWGYISDRFPIFGYKRKSWYVLMALLALVFWVINAVLAAAGVKIPLVFLAGFVLALSTYAFVDVVTDALMVEQGRKVKNVGGFVSHQWTMLSISFAGVAFLGGWFADLIQGGALDYWMVFLAVGIFPLATLIVGLRNIDEERVVQKSAEPLVRKRELWIDMARAARKSRNIPRAFSTFCRENKTLWILVLFIFFWKFSPSVGYIERSYLLDVREFSGTAFGIVSAVGGIIFLLSILAYRMVVRHFRRIEWHHYLFAMVALGVLSFPASFFYYLDPSHPWWKYVMIFALPDSWNPLPEWNRYMWIMLLSTTTLGFATIPAFLIPLTLAGETVKIAHAGMSYAFLMAFINVTGALESSIGAGLYAWFSAESMEWLRGTFESSMLNIATTSDERTLILQMFVYIGLVFTMLTIPFIVLLRRALGRENVQINLDAKKD